MSDGYGTQYRCHIEVVVGNREVNRYVTSAEEDENSVIISATDIIGIAVAENFDPRVDRKMEITCEPQFLEEFGTTWEAMF